METETLATVNGSPEFTFPVQLVYLNFRAERGGFGEQWFCPQLDSQVLPKSKGVLAWQAPGGGMIGLFADEHQPTKFATRGGDWRAKMSGPTVTITSADGWQYLYREGRLQSIVSPMRRELAFSYAGRNLSQWFSGTWRLVPAECLSLSHSRGMARSRG